MGLYAHTHPFPPCPPHNNRCPEPIGIETCQFSNGYCYCTHADFDGLDAMRLDSPEEKAAAMKALAEQTLQYSEDMFPVAEKEKANGDLIRVTQVRGHFHRGPQCSAGDNNEDCKDPNVLPHKCVLYGLTRTGEWYMCSHIDPPILVDAPATEELLRSNPVIAGFANQQIADALKPSIKAAPGARSATAATATMQRFEKAPTLRGKFLVLIDDYIQTYQEREAALQQKIQAAQQVRSQAHAGTVPPALPEASSETST